MATNMLSKQDKTDVRLASALVLNPLLKDEGIQAIQQALQGSQDPPAALATVIFQALGQVRDTAAQKGVPLSDKIWTARRGVLETVIQDVCQALASIPPEMPEAVDPEFMQDVKEEVFNLMDGQQASPQGDAMGQQGTPDQGMMGQGPAPMDGPSNLLAMGGMA